ncbi:hypothetical protein VN97_g12724 [Penicillium thymicola]|uniref:Uncharacterized protein n=1 Tax=Penicillium thymicola TaxID=293382 RepID=A0AAI9T4X6_PENTH|nr:hypothetical protein VN97_g12724 [Penicillium thymicola]
MAFSNACLGNSKPLNPAILPIMIFRGLESKYPKFATVNDEIVLFNPCFFRPHPDRLLQKYPVNLDPEENEKPPRLRLVPTFDEILEDCQEEYSDPEEVQQAVESQIEALQNLQYDEDWYMQGLPVYHYIGWQLHASRTIQPGIYCLWDLGDQEFFS